jgi:hypothetical protein
MLYDPMCTAQIAVFIAANWIFSDRLSERDNACMSTLQLQRLA